VKIAVELDLRHRYGGPERSPLAPWLPATGSIHTDATADVGLDLVHRHVIPAESIFSS